MKNLKLALLVVLAFASGSTFEIKASGDQKEAGSQAQGKRGLDGDTWPIFRKLKPRDEEPVYKTCLITERCSYSRNLNNVKTATPQASFPKPSTLAVLALAPGIQTTANESDKEAAFITWADEKRAPMPEASYDLIERKCKNLDIRMRVKAYLIQKYSCGTGIDSLVDAYGNENRERLQELENEPWPGCLGQTPYMMGRSSSVKNRGPASVPTLWNLKILGSPVYEKLRDSHGTDKEAAERLHFLIEKSKD